jgi:hypothetical protein
VSRSRYEESSKRSAADDAPLSTRDLATDSSAASGGGGWREGGRQPLQQLNVGRDVKQRAELRTGEVANIKQRRELTESRLELSRAPATGTGRGVVAEFEEIITMLNNRMQVSSSCRQPRANFGF